MKHLLRQLLDAAVASAQPGLVVPKHLPQPGAGRTIVVGAGKASAEMAKAVEKHWSAPLEGLVVTRYGHGSSCHRIEIVEAAHPVPDEAGQRAAARMLKLVANLSRHDLVICLISGGGSALLPLPLGAVTLQDKQQLSRSLLASGASISEMNCIRRHLSAIKGGRLAAACHPARVVSLIISDVPGDSLMDIASGPTAGDTTTCADALEILARYGIVPPGSVKEVLESAAGESVKPDDPRLERCENILIATPQRALEAAAEVARRAGILPIILSDSIEGESREVAKVLAAIARQVADHGKPFPRPCVLLSGGETTVSIKGPGHGGRNVEFLLSLCLALRGHRSVHALAADTDGVDGSRETAGAYISPKTLEIAARLGLNAQQELDRNNAHVFFERVGASIVTGPTLTNVNDFRAVLISETGDCDAQT
ncbi:MAG: glycerate kinase [Pseudomonadota bacterium]|jgi:glycerate 2-kinase